MKRFFMLLTVFALAGAGCVDATSPVNPDASPETSTGTTLDLHGQDLSAIPKSVFDRTELEHLDLSDNALTGAPQAELGRLQHLKTLNLSQNHLTGLPAEIGRLNQLEILDVSNNDLTGLPLELGHLTGLKVLDLTGNPYSQQDLAQIVSGLPNTEIRK